MLQCLRTIKGLSYRATHIIGIITQKKRQTSYIPIYYNLFSKMDLPIPEVRRDDTVVEDLHGVKVPDPYRWLEDPDSEETKKFVDAQNAITVAYIEKCRQKEVLKSKLTELWNYPKYSAPFKRGSRYFFFMNTGLQNQSVMYVQDSIDDEPRVFFDPNVLADDGTTAIKGSAFSEDGEIYAYSLSKCGSDWISIHFKKVATGEDYPEVLEKIKFSTISWTHDHKGIFYCCYPDQEGKTDGTETTSAENEKLFYHRLNTPQSEDILVVEFIEHPKWLLGAEVSYCGKYLIVTAAKDCKDNLVYYAPLPTDIDGKITLHPVTDVFEAEYEYITNDGPNCIFHSNKDAPNYRLIKIDLTDSKPENWTVLIPEHEKDVLDWADCVHNDKLVVCWISDVKSILQVRNLADGQLVTTLPLDIGTVSGYSGRRNQSEIFYSFTSFLSPGIIYYLDFAKGDYSPQVFREIKVKGIDCSSFEMKQVFYTSKDGTKIPMFLFHRKGLPRNSSATTLVYGYGGFNVSLMPYFSISRLLFAHMFNGIVAIPNLRGGGEYGESWHNAGRLLNKQNVFDDFQAAAEYLISEKYTSSDHLIIQGHSNGGLLTGACVNQRPDLFKVGLLHVGVMDMLRFHKFTIGHVWTSDFGNPDEEKHFKNVYNFSPLHNVKRPPNGGQYPALLLTTADHDDRVMPLHSFKLVSELQHTLCKDNPNQTNPIIIRIETKGGHGAGKPTTKVIGELVDIYCFIIEAMGIKELNTNFDL